MKKIPLIILIFTLLTQNIRAQETTATFAKKDNVLGVGFGIGGVYGVSGFSSQSPAFGVQYDRGIVELGMGGVIGVGGFVGYKSIVNKFTYNGDILKDKWNILIIGARGTFHYDLFEVPNLDTYAGTMIAFHVVNKKEDYPTTLFVSTTSHTSAVYASIFAGAKYYFTPHVAAFGELGYGVSWLTLGVAFKF